MAPKKNARDTTASPARTVSTGTASPAPTTKQSSSARSGAAANWDVVLHNLQKHYIKETPQRTKLIDIFLAYLVFVGAVQFFYCVVAGNYPFNAFLSGFGATVGQFILTVSLRIQTTEGNKGNFSAVSPERLVQRSCLLLTFNSDWCLHRAFADYVICSLFLHFFCVNFIN
ncbi:hypothetical protein L249_3619 [Ophiocordyceps polyrhachis-furcata BCC 54312]|uniref:Dolichyl-diphosphooligosaccharide--protein glycosyltransferase subunit OST2 n=1 Tax=Ophiocordyceps polyrhachis-furcata BCC 54312 TaxID=1330021 RepID=A0A367LM05_9HYPO|nr:hypothetical protein L249_3619 [Ophiocordyceps polyrhachis-furcata BCC 54312]